MQATTTLELTMYELNDSSVHQKTLTNLVSFSTTLASYQKICTGTTPVTMTTPATMRYLVLKNNQTDYVDVTLADASGSNKTIRLPASQAMILPNVADLTGAANTITFTAHVNNSYVELGILT